MPYPRHDTHQMRRTRLGGVKLRKEKKIVAFAVWICLLLTSIQSVLADGTVSVSDPTGDLLVQGEQAAPSQYYLSFIDVVEAHVTLSSGTYTFELTVASTPSDWLTSTWNPRFASPLDQIRITRVSYRWRIFESSGSTHGVLRVVWRGDQGGTVDAGIAVCPPAAAGEACLDGGVGLQILHPLSLAFSFNQAANSVSLTISQSDLASIFPAGTQWRSITNLIYGSQIAVAGNVITDPAPEVPVALPV